MECVFNPERLTAFIDACYRKLGLAAEPCELLTDSLVQADLWGHQSHGVMRTFWYGDRFLAGSTVMDARPEWVMDAGALAVLDARNGIGQVTAELAMTEAVRRSKQHGIGAVSVRNSNHFGTAMYFTRLAARDGCIGFLSTNASPAMAPWGGREKRVGNNPWSIAAPAGKYPPMMLDIANTAVARGKLYLARQKREGHTARLGSGRERSADHRAAGRHRRHDPAHGRSQRLCRGRHDGRHLRCAQRERIRPGGIRPLPGGKTRRRGAFGHGHRHRPLPAPGRFQRRYGTDDRRNQRDASSRRSG